MGLAFCKNSCCCCGCDRYDPDERFTHASLSSKDQSKIYNAIQKEKLLTFKLAVEPVRRTFVELDKQSQKALEKCVHPCQFGLTKDEAAAIYFLGLKNGETSVYEQIRRTWESGDEKQLRIWFPYLKLLFSGLDKLPDVQTESFQAIPHDATWDKMLRSKSSSLFKMFGFASLSSEVPKKYFERKGNRKLIYIAFGGLRNKDCKNYLPPGFDGVLLYPGLRVLSVNSFEEMADGSIIFHFSEQIPLSPPGTAEMKSLSPSSILLVKHFVCQNRLCSNRCPGNHAYDHCRGFYFIKHGCDHHCGEKNRCGRCRSFMDNLRQCNKCGVHWCEPCSSIEQEFRE